MVDSENSIYYHCGVHTKIVNVRFNHEKNTVRRRRECVVCGHRFSTIETLIASPKKTNRGMKRNPALPMPPKGTR